jgi:hypothetical protein
MSELPPQLTREFMLCRNQVADFEHWKSVFDSHAGDPRAVGLELQWIRQSLGDPASAAVGEEAGVIDGEYHFIRNPGPAE